MEKKTMGVRLVLDAHTHTIASGHAFGTVREMARAASEKGLSLLGVTEHGPGIPGTCEPIYFANLLAAPRRLYGVEMVYGSEVNVLNDGTISLKQFVERLDYAIAGIHTTCYRDEGRERNTDNLISCMRHGKVRFVSHPDDDHTPLDYPRLVAAAKELHVALELNNSSLLKPQFRLNCVENYRTMLPLCEELGVPVLVSSDAHDPDDVGRFDEALALLEELHFDPSLLLNTDAERFKRFIAYPK